MKKIFRIRKRKDFLLASQSGLCYRAGFFIALANPTTNSNYRVGFTASKRIGNAIVRNRSKRRMRAMTRQLMPNLGLAGVDYVFIAKKNLISAKWKDFLDEGSKAILFLNKKINKKNEEILCQKKKLK